MKITKIARLMCLILVLIAVLAPSAKSDTICVVGPNYEFIGIMIQGNCCQCSYFAGEYDCFCSGGTTCATCGSGSGWCCIDHQDVR